MTGRDMTICGGWGVSEEISVYTADVRNQMRTNSGSYISMSGFPFVKQNTCMCPSTGLTICHVFFLQ
jgi:hypothetical protein